MYLKFILKLKTRERGEISSTCSRQLYFNNEYETFLEDYDISEEDDKLVDWDILSKTKNPTPLGKSYP